MAEMAQSDRSIASDLLEKAKSYAWPDPSNPHRALDQAEAELDRHIGITSIAKRMARTWLDIVLFDNKLDKHKFTSFTALECRLLLDLAQYVGEEMSRG